MKFAILGSCVTRDIFSELDLDEYVGEYRARTSLHTFFEEPISIDRMPNLEIITSSFQRRMVEADFRKKDIEMEDCDYLIVDFIMTASISLSSKIQESLSPSNYQKLSAKLAILFSPLREDRIKIFRVGASRVKSFQRILLGLKPSCIQAASQPINWQMAS